MDRMEFQDNEPVTKLLFTLKELGINRLDTAARYPPFNTGRSEQLLGVTVALSDGFVINTKVYTEVGDGSGDLTQSAIQQLVASSLDRLHRPQGVDVLFEHRPDPTTPLEDQIQGFQEQIARGHAKVWGVANHAPETLQRIWIRAKSMAGRSRLGAGARTTCSRGAWKRGCCPSCARMVCRSSRRMRLPRAF